MTTDPPPAEAAVLPQEFVQALWSSGQTVIAERGQAAGLYKVNGGRAIGSWDVAVLAWQVGVLIGPKGIQ